MINFTFNLQHVFSFAVISEIHPVKMLQERKQFQDYKRFVKEFQRTFISDITSYFTEKTVSFFNKTKTKEQLFWLVNQEIRRSWQESFLDFCRGLPVWINLFLCCCCFFKKYDPYSEFKVLMRFGLPFRDVLERLRASARIGLISDIKKNTRPMYLVTICSDSTVFTFIIRFNVKWSNAMKNQLKKRME